MKTRNLCIAGLISLLFVLACNDEDEISAPIVGVWAGNTADFKVNPDGIIPAFSVTEDNFPVKLEFRNDGSLILTDDSQASTTGTYEMSGRNLTINIDYEFEFIGLSGTYNVEELTNTKLRASIEKEGNYEHPDTGQNFDGSVEATLFFDRQAD